MEKPPTSSSLDLRSCQPPAGSVLSPALSLPGDGRVAGRVASDGKLSPRRRRELAVAGAALVAALATAAWLRPDPSGRGTHRQLGLPPCTLLMLFDVPCPSCGMTTAWSHLMHGRPAAAAHANLGGTVLGLVALAAGPWMLACSAWGRWMWLRPSDKVLALAVAAWIGLTLIDWGLRTW